MAKIATLEELQNGMEFYLQNLGSGSYVTAFPQNNKALHAASDHIGIEIYFKFEKFGLTNDIFFLKSTYHNCNVSAIGEGWPLLPTLSTDINWQKFKFRKAADGISINIQTAHPKLKITDPIWVSVIGEPRILRVAENTPRLEWSYFIPYLRE